MKRPHRIAAWTLLGLAALLIALHLALPYLVRGYINRAMADMGDYRGHVEDVDLAWWRGAYRIDGLRIVKTDGDVPVPLLKAPEIDLAVSWRDLWRHQAMVARVLFVQPELNFVHHPDDPGQTQAGTGVDWQTQLERLLPITLNRVRVRDGHVHFRNYASKPNVHLRADEVCLRVRNLTNTAGSQGERVAHFTGTARLFGHAPLEASADFDPLADFSDFNLKLRVTDVRLRRVNDFARAYGNFDFADGHGDLVVEARARNGQLDGYVKPLLKNVEVFQWRQDVERKNKGLLQGAWEALVGGTEELLQNQDRAQFATQVPLSGNIDNQETSPFQAFLAVLRNAFIKAFNPTFEDGAAQSSDG